MVCGGLCVAVIVATANYNNNYTRNIYNYAFVVDIVTMYVKRTLQTGKPTFEADVGGH